MEIQSLRYAVTLAEELHFGRAAQRHFIAAQPFGRHIQRLEREVGRRLFERTSRKVMLTPAGERLVAEARRVLAAVDGLAEAVRSSEPAVRSCERTVRSSEPAVRSSELTVRSSELADCDIAAGGDRNLSR
ncbi:hypothetical protein GCM10009850_118760 [Nonomuraea monospora]|uniref:HTH lysR-type domain-containing protein n=1 Tax=Nonomuraea monospora TaxID=568818 RepID=A0ABN3D3J3_9ACTN